MNDIVESHAIRYAAEKTKIYMIEKFRLKYPDVFGSAVVETRPAVDDEDDYYVPPSIADRCIVVTSTRFQDELSCIRLSCFPFKDHLESCENDDAVRWIRLGQGFALACQPTCTRHPNNVDAEWRRGKCIMINPLKKMLAMMPEHLFGKQKGRRDLHGGLDLVDGHLRLNRRYCEAYGLEFNDDDCVEARGQSIAEFFIGKTGYRSIRASHITTPLPDFPAQDPKDYFFPSYNNSNNNKRVKRQNTTTIHTQTFSSPSPQALHVLRDLVRDLSIDAGVDVSLYAAEKWLVKKAPQLLERAITNVYSRSAVKLALLENARFLGMHSLRMAGRLLGTVGFVFTVVTIVTDLVDFIDPHFFNSVMTKKLLDVMDRNLDVQFFERLNEEVEVTPELMTMVWTRDEEEEDEKYQFMEERIKEYVEALMTTNSNNNNNNNKDNSQQPERKLKLFVGTSHTEQQWNWHRHIHWYLMGLLTVLTVLFVQWIHIWVTLFFFVMLMFENTF